MDPLEMYQWIVALSRRPVELRFEEVKKVLTYYGYQLINSRGSHFHFKKSYCPSIFIVSHKGKVKKWYVKDMCKTLLLQLSPN